MSDENSPRNECILAIGDTGLGKSFTATVFGAKKAQVGHGTKSKTQNVTFYDIGNESFYVDTPGFNDSNEEKADNETVRSILRKMWKRKVYSITTILWFVAYTDRETASLKRQAKIIEAFAQDHTGNVWDNVIIVTKYTKRGAGPRAAAKEVAEQAYEKKYNCQPVAGYNLLKNTENFEIFLLEKFDDEQMKIYNDLPPEVLKKLNIFKENKPEILAKYRSLMEGHVVHPISLGFKKLKCINCTEETDPRMANPKCHSKTKQIHPEASKTYHNKGVEYYHIGLPTNGKLVKEMDHSVGAWTLRIATVGLVNLKDFDIKNGTWTCCNNELGSNGCKKRYACCGRSESDSGCVYTCCGTQSPGCKSVCSNCEKNPVENEGCTIEAKHAWIH